MKIKGTGKEKRIVYDCCICGEHIDPLEGDDFTTIEDRYCHIGCLEEFEEN
jgi:hypothetical protein